MHRVIGLFFTVTRVGPWSRVTLYLSVFTVILYLVILMISMIFARVNRLLHIPLANVNSQYVHTYVGNYNLQKKTVRLLKLTLHRYLTGIVDPIHAETRYP